MTLALVTNAPAAVAISLTAMLAFSRPAPRIEVPTWVPWAFLVILGIGSCWFALGHPDAMGDGVLSMEL